ncbi:MAG: tripartite tricarboxylate transporter substrate-binding protein, partial [Pseudomonadota bacterium]
MVVATVPGGGTDAIARILAGKLSELLGQQFVIDNRGGAGGIIGTETVARAPADGYTLLMGFIASLAMNPALVRTPYDPLKDFTPVSLVASAQYVMTIHPSVPAKTLKDLVAYAKTNPGKINYASAGNGTPVHLAAELFKSVAGVNLTHIPYKG